MTTDTTEPAPKRAPHTATPTVLIPPAPKALVVLASISLAAALLPAVAAIIMALNGQL